MTDTQAVRMVPVDVLTRCAALLEDPKAEHPHDVSYLVEELNALAAAPSVQPDKEVIERLTKFANSLTGEFSSVVIPAKVAKQAAEDIRAVLPVHKEEG